MKDITLKQIEVFLGKSKVKHNFDLTPYITLRTKALAQYYFEPETKADLIKAKKASLKLNLPLFLFAGGSNLAFLKEKISGLVIRNKYIFKKIIAEESEFVYLTVSSGYPVSQLVQQTIDEGLEGLEYHLGLPGTIGGAVYMNSKWTKPVSYFGDHLIWANLIGIDGKEKKVDRSYFHFSYDYSSLQKTKEILLEATFRLKKSKREILEKRAEKVLAYRRRTQPHGVFSSGCFFKNISLKDQKRLKLPTSSAGYLIDQSGLKGCSVGRFYVSGRHANFIINQGGGNSKDLVKLLQLIKSRVKNKFGVRLEEEVIIL